MAVGRVISVSRSVFYVEVRSIDYKGATRESSNWRRKNRGIIFAQLIRLLSRHFTSRKFLTGDIFYALIIALPVRVRMHGQRIVWRVRRLIPLSPPSWSIAAASNSLYRLYAATTESANGREDLMTRWRARCMSGRRLRGGGRGVSEKKRLEFTKWRSSLRVCDHIAHDSRIVCRDVEPPISITICFRGHVDTWRCYDWIWRNLHADR